MRASNSDLPGCRCCHPTDQPRPSGPASEGVPVPHKRTHCSTRFRSAADVVCPEIRQGKEVRLRIIAPAVYYQTLDGVHGLYCRERFCKIKAGCHFVRKHCNRPPADLASSNSGGRSRGHFQSARFFVPFALFVCLFPVWGGEKMPYLVSVK